MAQANHPSKYLVRSWLERRTHEAMPPPAPQEIRRQLGWGLCPATQPPCDARSR